MSLVSLADAQARAGDSITQDQIDEVEDHWTAIFGPLIGERTETFYLSEARQPRWWIDGLWLSRRTASVVVTSNSIGESASTLTEGTDYRLLNGLLIEQIPNSTGWLDTMAVTYTPTDEELVRSVIFDTLSYRQTPAGLQSVRIGAYSETFFPSATESGAGDPVLGSLMRRVLPHASLGIYGGPFRYAIARRDRTLITSTGS
jgi:hypothetical protein